MSKRALKLFVISNTHDITFLPFVDFDDQEIYRLQNRGDFCDLPLPIHRFRFVMILTFDNFVRQKKYLRFFCQAIGSKSTCVQGVPWEDLVAGSFNGT